ncbi:MAG: hypothetical protein ABIZ72_03230 [Candidatus Limnocylindrales bacterium]
MNLVIDTVKFAILTICAVAFAAVGVLITSVLGLKRSVSTV